MLERLVLKLGTRGEAENDGDIKENAVHDSNGRNDSNHGSGERGDDGGCGCMNRNYDAIGSEYFVLLPQTGVLVATDEDLACADLNELEADV